MTISYQNLIRWNIIAIYFDTLLSTTHRGSGCWERRVWTPRLWELVMNKMERSSKWVFNSFGCNSYIHLSTRSIAGQCCWWRGGEWGSNKMANRFKVVANGSNCNITRSSSILKLFHKQKIYCCMYYRSTHTTMACNYVYMGMLPHIGSLFYLTVKVYILDIGISWHW